MNGSRCVVKSVSYKELSEAGRNKRERENDRTPRDEKIVGYAIPPHPALSHGAARILGAHDGPAGEYGTWFPVRARCPP